MSKYRKLEPGINDLATTNPNIAAWWHPTKNIGLKNKKGEDVSTPDKVTSGSELKIWWIFPYDVPMDYPIEHLRGRHYDFEWDSKIYVATKVGYQCPYLTGHAVWKGWNDLETVFPKIAAEWDYEANQGLLNKYGEDISTPDKVTAGSHFKVFWKCAHGHSWTSTVKDRTAGHNCPYCSGRYSIENESDLQSSRPDIASEWHPILNENLTPRDVKAGSRRKVWWQCRVCNQNWPATINARTQGNGCPYCSGKLPITNVTDLASKSPKIADEWDYEGNKKLKDENGRDISTPDKVTIGSNQKVWWKCSTCTYKWLATINDRVNKKSGCPRCAGNVIAQGKDLRSLYPDIADEWDYEANKELTDKNGNDVSTPDKVGAGSNIKVGWKCSVCGYKWNATITNRTGNNSGCPHCIESKGEKAIRKVLENNYITFEAQYKFKDRFCVSKKGLLRDDFAILNSNGQVVGTIEYNGIQHYEVVDFSGKNKNLAKNELTKNQLRDKIKSDYLAAHNISQLIIPYWDFDNIPTLVLDYIQKLSQEHNIFKLKPSTRDFFINRINQFSKKIPSLISIDVEIPSTSPTLSA